MILRKKKRIRELEKENRRLRKIIEEQEKTISSQKLKTTFSRMIGSD